MGKKYTDKEIAKKTGSSGKEVARAHHQARDDAEKSDHPTDKRLSEGWKRKPNK